MIFVKQILNTVVASGTDKVWVKLSSQALDDLAGTWVFNDTLDFTAHGNILLRNIPLAFISNGTEYTTMTIYPGTTAMNRQVVYGTTKVFLGSFQNTAYKTVEISTTFAELSANYENADLVLAFMQANATKVS